MKKYFVFILMVCSTILYSQTWTEKEMETRLERECTIITKEQFNRLLRQYEEDHGACNFYYYDILELGNHNRPEVNGEHYILIRRKTHSGIAPALAYGNSNTGRMEIWFSRWFNTKVESAEYRRRFEQLFNRVNGK